MKISLGGNLARKGVLCAVRMRMVAATVTSSGLQAAAQHPSAAFTARDDALAWQSAMHHGAMPLHVFGAAHTNAQLLLGCDRASYGSMPCDSASSEWHASAWICNSRLQEQRASSSCATPMQHSGIAANPIFALAIVEASSSSVFFFVFFFGRKFS